MLRNKLSYLYGLVVVVILASTLSACSSSVDNRPAPAGLEIVTAPTASATNAAATTAATTSTSTTAVATTSVATTAATTTTSVASTTSPVGTTAQSTTSLATTTAPATATTAPTQAPTAKPAAAAPALKKGVLLSPMSWQAQTWNNCAPMSAVMTLSYYGVTLTQQECANALRPNQGDASNPSGDKHVRPEELTAFITSKGFKTLELENGTIDQLRALLSAGIPVITQQWLHDDDDIGHYRVARGYDMASNVLIYNDSMDNKPETVVDVPEEEKLWKGFDHRFFPVYTASQQPVVDAILGKDADPATSLDDALIAAKTYSEQQPGDIDAWRNLGYLYYAKNDCQDALNVWEQHLTKMLKPSDNGPYNRFLWYQLWPVECYNAVGNYQQVVKIVPNELQHAVIYAEARYEYAFALAKLGQTDAAITQLKKALLDDQNYKPTYDLLAKLGAS